MIYVDISLWDGKDLILQYSEKLNQLWAKVVTLSDSSGMIYDPDGIDNKKLAYVMELKNIKRGCFVWIRD